MPIVTPHLHAISHMYMQSSATHKHPTPPTQPSPPSFFAHRVSEADGANMGVGLAAIAVGAAAKRLGRRVELHVALQANHSLVFRLRAHKIGALRRRAEGLACPCDCWSQVTHLHSIGGHRCQDSTGGRGSPKTVQIRASQKRRVRLPAAKGAGDRCTAPGHRPVQARPGQPHAAGRLAGLHGVRLLDHTQKWLPFHAVCSDPCGLQVLMRPVDMQDRHLILILGNVAHLPPHQVP